MMHQRLLVVLNNNSYNNVDVCAVINMGCMVYDFFHVYDKCEPDALGHHDKLLLLLADLDKGNQTTIGIGIACLFPPNFPILFVFVYNSVSQQ